MQDMVYEWVNFSIFSQIKEILEKSNDFAKNFAKKSD